VRGLKLAILGSTGQIGRCLARAYGPRSNVTLFSRRPEVATSIARQQRLSVQVAPFEDLRLQQFDVIVNAVGDGEPSRILRAGAAILDVTARYDQLCLEQLERHPETSYVFLSTGAIYGPDYAEARKPDPTLRVPLATHEPDLFYPLAKRIAELRHRERSALRIADLRIFGFVSSEMSLDNDLLLAHMMRALSQKDVFVTRADEAPRDYIGIEDLVRMIDLWIEQGCPNDAYDILSAAPTSKFRVLDALKRRFGLEHRVDVGERRELIPLPERLSHQRGAEALGYRACRSSLDQVLHVAEAYAAVRSTRSHEVPTWA